MCSIKRQLSYLANLKILILEFRVDYLLVWLDQNTSVSDYYLTINKFQKFIVDDEVEDDVKEAADDDKKVET